MSFGQSVGPSVRPKSLLFWFLCKFLNILNITQYILESSFWFFAQNYLNGQNDLNDQNDQNDQNDENDQNDQNDLHDTTYITYKTYMT